VATTRRMSARRLAIALWTVLAVVVWNVVFDHVIVVAGREYLAAAVIAAGRGGPYARADQWMQPAATRGLWLASAASAAVLAVGLAAIRLASRTPRKQPTSTSSGRRGT
jgi:hypothetical protein